MKDKVCVITGGSRGIGEAIATKFAAEGAIVVVCSRKLDTCEHVAAKLRGAGGRAEARTVHIGDPASLEALVVDVVDAHGRIDVLVNNAAANPYFGHVLDIELDAFEKTFDVNVRGSFWLSVLAGRAMRAGDGGVILNVASVDGVRAGTLRGVYSMTKAALIQMTKAFANECASDGIRVNGLLPGLTKTKFASALTENPAIAEAALAHIPMKRFANPDEMAGAALYLCSDASSYTTGACLEVDGGYLLV